jgi:sugar phosphate isomerase/epimerase
MPIPPTADDLRRHLKRRGVRLNTLHAALRIPSLDERKRTYHREREQRIVKLVEMLGGLRRRDLQSIIFTPQPTVWRIVERLRSAGALRVVTTYRDGAPGARAAWLQPPRSADIPDERRAELLETAELIKEYVRLWGMEEALATLDRQRAEGLLGVL